MKIIDPADLTIKLGLPPVAKKGDMVSIDTEWFGQEKSRLHIPHGTFAGAGFSYDGETVYIVTDIDFMEEAFQRVDDAVWVIANAKYDIRQLRKYFRIPQRKKIWDVMLIEQIMFSGYYDGFALDDLARRYLDVYMDKGVRESFGDTSSLTKEQIEYLAVDVVAQWRVKKEQHKIIDDDDLHLWKHIERPFLWTILGMSGIRLDVDKWNSLAELNQSTADALQEKYGDLNLASPIQVKAHFADLGYSLASTGASVVETLVDECEFAKDLLEFRTASKRASTYGKSFVEKYVDEDGYIYSDIFQIGAQTGRTSCRNPNLQNQPHEDKYRDCFVADDEEHCITVADWSSQEPRIAAWWSGDEKLAEALNSDEKLYVRVARDALGISITKESPEYSYMKSTVLGIFYGMRAKALAQRLDVSEDDAQGMINLILKTYPGIADYIEQQEKAKDYVTSVYGRKIWLNKYQYNWLNIALNAPIQGSAADAMKIGGYKLTCELDGKDFYDNTHLKMMVHDEFVIGSTMDRCEENKEVMRRVMVTVAEKMHDGIKADAEIFTGNSWACKK